MDPPASLGAPSILRPDKASRYRAAAPPTSSNKLPPPAARPPHLSDWPVLHRVKHAMSAAASSDGGDSDSDTSSYPNLGGLGLGLGNGSSTSRNAPPARSNSLFNKPLSSLGRPLQTLRMQTLHGQSFFNLPVGATLGDGDAALKDVTEDELQRVRLWNFFRGHLAFFVCSILVGGTIIAGRDGFRYIDGLYLASGAMTGASLTPVVVRFSFSPRLGSEIRVQVLRWRDGIRLCIRL